MDRRKSARLLRRTAAFVVVTIVLALVTLKLRYGRGTPYPDVSSTPLVADKDVVAVVSLDFPPGNVAGSRDGRVFFNLHPIAHADRFTDAFLFELVDGKPHPYPDAASQPELRFVFGMTVDRQNRLWLTAPAAADRESTRLLAYDLTSNTKVFDHELDPGVARFGQDLRIAPDGKTVLLANASAFRFTAASLVLVDIATWKSRQLLIGDPSTQAQDWVMTVRGGPYRVAYGLINFEAGLDGLSISPDGQWLFLGPMSNDTLFRVPVADVLDPAVSPKTLAAHVVRVGKCQRAREIAEI